MAQASRSQSRGGFILGALLVAIVAIRLIPHFSGSRSLTLASILVGLFALYYAIEPTLSARLPWHKFIYFPVQTSLVFSLCSQQPFMDVAPALYIALILPFMYSFTRRIALSGVMAYGVLLTATQIVGLGWLGGLGISMLMFAVAAFMVSGDMLYNQAKADQEESQAMLARLQEAHRKLQESATRAEELAAARERNRLARELHDSVSQMIFSITLVARSTQLLLERDPSRVAEQLDRLQEMTAAALSQLRSLITQMRPPQNI